MVSRLSSTQVHPQSTIDESTLAAIEQAIRLADANAFPVPPRIVRRAIRNEFELPTLSARIPHRKSLVISGERASQILMPDELSIGESYAYPETLILLARPEETELERMTPQALSEYFRRLHLHARIDMALAEKIASGQLDENVVRSRINEIGRTAFGEIRAVLRHEAYLLPPVTTVSIYAEFVAVFFELRFFAPDLLPIYFPSLDDLGRIEAILAQDIDADRILRMTEDLSVDESLESIDTRESVSTTKWPPLAMPRSDRAVQRLLRDAATAFAKGNDVRAAILHMRAAAATSDSQFEDQAEELAAENIDRLARRLQTALALEPQIAVAWRELLMALLPHATYGFWNSDARLLYDLQKVCIDFERDTYVVDLGAWMRSFGRRPLKRPLPAQRDVLMSKHLRIAIRRLGKVQLSAGQREHLSILLHDSAAAAELRLRDRLRPTLDQTLTKVGFVPHNLPEKIAFKKIVEELLDAVVERGFFGMADIRDAIARNNLKLDDVADPMELIVGDRLLRADRRLDDELDGVYMRGAFYLRWLQRLSSCAFGTRVGRFFTLYAAIPFGGAYVILAGLDHLVHAIEGMMASPEPPEIIDPLNPQQVGHHVSESTLHLANPYLIALLGFVLLGLMHNQQFRNAVWAGLRGLGRVVKSVFIDLPRWLARVTLVNKLLRSAPVMFFRKRLLTALVLTLLFAWALPALNVSPGPSVTASITVFILLAALLNSRAGRDIEELTAERLQLTWHRIRVHVLVAMFDLIMDSFKRVLEWFERILYEVDEWLRFKSGETTFTLATKAVLGFAWSIVRFFLRFFTTVLFEPQINPIKHFPVVTVSHKIILPLGIPLSNSLVPVFGTVWANMIAGTTVFLVPGVFGFLVWELRGNWRLYAVNRHRDLRPVAIGSHGETMVRLLKLGLHSGTLPRLYSKLRRAARRANPTRRLRELMGYYGKLHHVEMEVRRFLEREFQSFLPESKTIGNAVIELGEIHVGTNSIKVELIAPEFEPRSMWIAFEEQSGRLVAGIWHPGWITQLNHMQSALVAGLILSLYRKCGVDLVREQIVDCLGPKAVPFEITDAGLALMSELNHEAKIVYDLNELPTIAPKTVGALQLRGKPVNTKSLVFGRSQTMWTDWIRAWTIENSGEEFPDLPPLEPVHTVFPVTKGAQEVVRL